jgi:dihydrofolate synthase / folylpolyglutamate synthase
MKVTPIQTPVVHAGDNLYQILDSALPRVEENSIVVVTSKIIALAEGSVVPKVEGTQQEKHDLVRLEAELYLEPDQSPYNLMLTVKHNIMAVNAGIDESNADDQYVLLPQDPYRSAREIWDFLRKRDGLQNLGTLIVDSKTFPLKWGTMGTALAHCGFLALNNRIGEKDLFGHEMQMTQVNVTEGLAAAAVLEMGEVAESQPLCLITEVAMVEFQDRPPTQAEIESLQITLEDDAYAPILTKAEWKRTG